MTFSFCFFLTCHGFKILTKYNFRIQYGISIPNDSARISYRQQTKIQILALLSSKVSILALFTFKIFQKMRMSEKCPNNSNNSDNPLTSCPTDGGKNWIL